MRGHTAGFERPVHDCLDAAVGVQMKRRCQCFEVALVPFLEHSFPGARVADHAREALRDNRPERSARAYLPWTTMSYHASSLIVFRALTVAVFIALASSCLNVFSYHAVGGSSSTAACSCKRPAIRWTSGTTCSRRRARFELFEPRTHAHNHDSDRCLDRSNELADWRAHHEQGGRAAEQHSMTL